MILLLKDNMTPKQHVGTNILLVVMKEQSLFQNLVETSIAQ